MEDSWLDGESLERFSLRYPVEQLPGHFLAEAILSAVEDQDLLAWILASGVVLAESTGLSSSDVNICLSTYGIERNLHHIIPRFLCKILTKIFIPKFFLYCITGRKLLVGLHVRLQCMFVLYLIFLSSDYALIRHRAAMIDHGQCAAFCILASSQRPENEDPGTHCLCMH